MMHDTDGALVQDLLVGAVPIDKGSSELPPADHPGNDDQYDKTGR